ncbi:MAG: PAS domain-containing protein, partial [bacterium]
MKKYPNKLPKQIRQYKELIPQFDDDFVFLYDPKGTLLWCNKHFLEVLKIPWEVVNSIKIQDLIFEDMSKPVKDFKRHLFRKGRLVSIRLVADNLRELSTSKTIKTDQIYRRDIDLEPMGLTLRAHVIKLKSNNFLMLSKVYYNNLEKVLARYSRDCIVILDNDDKIVGYSSNFGHLASKPGESIVGYPVWSYIHKPDWDNYKNKLKQTKDELIRIARLPGFTWEMDFFDDFKTDESYRKWKFDALNSWKIKENCLEPILKAEYAVALIDKEIPQNNRDLRASVSFEFQRG